MSYFKNHPLGRGAIAAMAESGLATLDANGHHGLHRHCGGVRQALGGCRLKFFEPIRRILLPIAAEEVNSHELSRHETAFAANFYLVICTHMSVG